MIRSFANGATEDLFDGVDSRRARRACPVELWPVVTRKLTQINRVRDLHELAVSPGNRLERRRGLRTATEPAASRALVRRRLPTERPPTHPGEMLLEEFLRPLRISQSAFAIQLGVSFPRLNEIVNRRRSVTPDTALRLAQVTGMSADFWLGLQQDWDLWHALRSKAAAKIARLEPLLAHPAAL